MLKFAIMMILGLTISFLTALVFTPSLMNVLGPQDEIGSVPQLSFTYLFTNNSFLHMISARFK